MHVLLAQQAATTSSLEPDFMIQLFRDVLGDLFSSPWLVGFFALIAVNAMVRTVRAVVHGRHSQDPQRRFSGFERAEIFARAGNRCEQHSWLFGRCRETEGLQADHVHPHSRGGATVIENGQALCRRHNKQKSARVPWNWELTRLARRREAYFPPGTPGAVVRRRQTDAGTHTLRP
jgi:5-methylcytosine-specific restriction endonuclease McrA